MSFPGKYDYKKYSILYVDDEVRSLKYFERIFGKDFRVITAPSAAEAWKIIEEQHETIGVLLTDQRMPVETGTKLLEKVRNAHPRIARILITAFSDISAAIEAVNTGAIYRYLNKPWDVTELEMSLRRALEFYIVQTERDMLLREKLSTLHDLIIKDRVASLGIVASGLSHHIRNSLVAIRTFLDLAPAKLREENIDLTKCREPNFWVDFYQQVQSQARRISELLGGLTETTDGNSLQFESINLKQIIDETLTKMSPQITESGIKVINHLEEDFPDLHASPTLIRKLIELLIKEELDVLSPNAECNITGQNIETPKGHFLSITVTDNGPGIPDEKLRSVFDPFVARSGEPSDFAINLMSCYLIAYHHGGKATVRAVKAGGTQFEFRFPISQETSDPEDQHEDFVSRVLMNDILWERLLSGA
ncbi:hybrid sensor histidine kinase/response regulator [Verrucomicrobia bacterium]|nr:hybrid sensor histidine kinase/response regulator [Verrucomicrobiota bacterium]